MPAFSVVFVFNSVIESMRFLCSYMSSVFECVSVGEKPKRNDAYALLNRNVFASTRPNKLEAFFSLYLVSIDPAHFARDTLSCVT